MTYRDRREARAERLRVWAAAREVKSDAAYAAVRVIGDQIPFGQPILVGHHSEGRARRDQQRMRTGMDRSVEHADKAQSMNARADNIEGQLARAIYSDDTDAVPALEARLAGLEAERDRIKTYNASCRKGARDLDLLDAKQRADLLSTATSSPYMIGKQGQMPGYVLTNLSGNITRNRKRLEQLRKEIR